MAEAAAKKPTGAEEFHFPDEGEDPSKKADENQEIEVEISDEGETEVNVEVIDDTPPEDRGRKVGFSKDVADVTDEELASHSERVKKRLQELSYARHDERRGREAEARQRQELERLVQSMNEENKRLKQYVQSGEQAYQGTAKAAAQAKLEIAKRKYREAHEAFDADQLIAAQQELTQAQLELAAAESFKPLPLQQDSEGVERQPSERAPQVPLPDARAVRWAQQNPWFGTDEEMTALALATHKRLVAAGFDPTSDDYYKRIDARIREKFPENFRDANPPADPPPRRNPATVVAPTARSSRAKKITLTQTQANLAKKLGITPEEYARHQALLETDNGR